MPLQSGSWLGPYEIVSAVGAGGMGEVYRARDVNLGRDVAVKVLPDAFARDSERLARFQREARLLASLSHSNIASIFGLQESAGSCALVMEFAEGTTLADRIRRGPIPAEEAIAIGRQIADALEYAHERGVVHRDLKPSNIKISPGDSVKILDFGLAKAVQGEASESNTGDSPAISQLATETGVLLGTAAYMAPEQAKGKPVDRRADVWAFGCVLYEMLSGKRAFTGESVPETLGAVLRGEPDWSLLPRQTPNRVQVLLQRCLQKDARQRLRDMGDARISLDEVLSGTPDPRPANVPRDATPLWPRAVPWAVAALLLVTLGSIALLRPGPPSWSTMGPMRFEIPLPEETSMAINGTFAVSPNGRQLAFAATGRDGVTRLWLRRFDSLEARPLPGTETQQLPPFFWSPDSRFVAFDAGGRLKKVDVSAGGPPQTVCDLPNIAVGGSWNRDGVIIFAQASGPLMRVSADGGPPTPVVGESRNGTANLFPSFLPDGRHFLYGHFSRDAKDGGFFVGSLDSRPGEQATRRIVSDVESDYVAASDGSGEVLFIRGGSLLAQPFDMSRLELSGKPVIVAEHVGTFGGHGFFSASDNGVLVYRTGAMEQSLQLTWFDRQGRVLTTAGEPRSFTSASLSPGATQVAFSDLEPSATEKRALEASGLWLLDVSRGTSTPLTFGSYAGSPTWSPDGSQIVFASRGIGLCEKPASGLKDEQTLLESSDVLRPTSWSRDGRYLLYTDQGADADAKAGLWVLPLEGADKKPVPFLKTDFNEQDGRFSPDGQWVAYTSDESGRNEVYVRAFSARAAGASVAGGGSLISNSGGSEPRWRGDGKELFYRAADGRLMAAEITPTPVFRAGIPEALFQMPPEGGPSQGSKWDPAPDGERFLIPAPRSTTTPFTVLLNWHHESQN
jgi:serine/threonine protein kinase